MKRPTAIKDKFNWRNGPGFGPIALAVWAALIGAAFLLAGC